MEQQHSSSLFQLNIDGASAYTLKSAASWAKVLAILGFIMGGLFVLTGVLFQTQFSSLSDGDVYDSRSATMAGNIGMVMYVIIGIIYIISSIFALNFANKTSTAMKTNDAAQLSSGLTALRNYIAFWAVLMIIALLFMFIAVAGLASA